MSAKQLAEECFIKPSKTVNINQQITAKHVRLIDADGQQVGVVSITQAFAAATQANLDLVEIVATSEPPVCRVMDYGKFQFEQRKKQNLQKKNQRQAKIKILKYRPTTEENDYQVKLRNLRKFIENGDKAKVVVRFRGRELMHHRLGRELMHRIETDILDIAHVEQYAKLEGRQMVMVLSPGMSSAKSAAPSVHNLDLEESPNAEDEN